MRPARLAEAPQNGGIVVLNSAVTTLTVYAATCTINGSGAVATLNCYGGTTYYNSTGALGGTAVALYESGVLDFSQDQQAKNNDPGVGDEPPADAVR